ncbi:MAG: hypothetical protein WC264_00465 [Candidatus Paceibacterota bacterium]|jgi:hypothetical protein
MKTLNIIISCIFAIIYSTIIIALLDKYFASAIQIIGIDFKIIFFSLFVFFLIILIPVVLITVKLAKRNYTGLPAKPKNGEIFEINEVLSIVTYDDKNIASLQCFLVKAQKIKNFNDTQYETFNEYESLDKSKIYEFWFEKRYINEGKIIAPEGQEVWISQKNKFFNVNILEPHKIQKRLCS